MLSKTSPCKRTDLAVTWGIYIGLDKTVFIVCKDSVRVSVRYSRGLLGDHKDRKTIEKSGKIGGKSG
jgi:hypothetical protein